MHVFLIKVAAFLVLQSAVFALLLARYDRSQETNYLAATVDKHRRLKETVSPRIVLVGGSNVAFGFESDRIERALGRPVVNMGLAAGLGLEFMLSEIEGALGTNDLVVLSPEYDHFARGPKSESEPALGFDPDLLRQALVFRPAGFADLGLPHLRKIVLDRGLTTLGEIGRRSLFANVRAESSARTDGPSGRAGFNVWGDVTAHRSEPSRVEAEVVNALGLVADPRGFPNGSALKRIREFVERCSRKGVGVAFSFSPKPVATLERDGSLAESLKDNLRQIPGLKLLDTPSEQAYPADHFFDTANHLTAAGTAVRTERLIRAVQDLRGRHTP